MPDLEETIRRLSASFAEEVIAALRDVPLDELVALSAAGDERRRRPPAAPKRRTRAKAASPQPRTTRAPEVGAASGSATNRAPSASVLDAAERVFAERGSRGATAAQLAERLAAQGLSQPDGAADVVRVLVEREIIRDAGFRRTTGQGTAPVFVACR